MTGSKTYLQPRDMVLGAIHDLAELQKAKTLLCDGPNGMIHLLVTMYTAEREYRFTVEEVYGNRSVVTIHLIGEETDKRRLVDNEFALLDYVLLDRTSIELAEMEAWDCKIQAEQQTQAEPGGAGAGNRHVHSRL